MAITRVGINLVANGSARTIANWNNVDSPGTTGVRVADCIDIDSGAGTGYTLTQNGAFAGGLDGGQASGTPDARFPVEFFNSLFYVGVASDDAATFTHGNLPVGASYTVEAAGCGGNASRDTTFSATGSTPSSASYDALAGTEVATQPVVLQGTVPANGQITISSIGSSVFAYNNGWILTIDDGAASGPSITEADDITDESQPATFTLSGNENAPTGITINGEAGSNITFVSEDTGAGTETYSYEPPLIADDDTADLVVSVGGTTAATVISYANSYNRDQLTHPATEAEYSENSLSYPNAYATTQPYEWKVIADANASVVAINWNALESDDGFHKNIASYATPVANGVTTVTLGVFVPETGQAYQFDRTITVSDGSVVVTGEGLWRELFRDPTEELFTELFR